MSDITKCNGEGCPAKEKCHRFTAKANDLYQSYFSDPPFVIDKGKFECDMYWGDSAELLFEQLKGIMNGNKKSKPQSKNYKPVKRSINARKN